MPIRFDKSITLGAVTGLDSVSRGQHRRLTMDATHIWTLYQGRSITGVPEGSVYLCRFDRSTGTFLNASSRIFDPTDTLSAYSGRFPATTEDGGLLLLGSSGNQADEVRFQVYKKDLSGRIDNGFIDSLTGRDSSGVPTPFDGFLDTSEARREAFDFVEILATFPAIGRGTDLYVHIVTDSRASTGTDWDSATFRKNVPDLGSLYDHVSLVGDADRRFYILQQGDGSTFERANILITVYDRSYSRLEGQTFTSTVQNLVITDGRVAQDNSVVGLHDNILGVLDYSRTEVDFYEYSLTAFPPRALVFDSTQDNLSFEQNTVVNHALPGAFGGTGELTYSVSTLPAGLSFSASARRIFGTPTTVSTTSVTYTVTDSALPPVTMTQSFSIAITAPARVFAFVSTRSNLRLTVGQSHSVVLPEAQNGVGTVTYALTNIPQGMSFDASTRILSGIPTQVSTQRPDYSATDSTTPSAQRISQVFTVFVSAAPVDPVDPPLVPVVTGQGIRQVSEDLSRFAIPVHFAKRDSSGFTLVSTQSALVKYGSEFIRASTLIDLRIELALLDVVPFETLPEMDTGDWIFFATEDTLTTPPVALPANAYVVIGHRSIGSSYRQIFVCEYVEGTSL